MNIKIAQADLSKNSEVSKMLLAIFTAEADPEEFLTLVTCVEAGKQIYSFIAHAEGGAVGILVGNTNKNDGIVDIIAVVADYRQQGVGAKLLAAFEEAMRNQGISRIKVGESRCSYIWPGVDTQYVSALVMFQREGFTRNGVIYNLKCNAKTNLALSNPQGILIQEIELPNLPEATAFAREKFSETWARELEIAVKKDDAKAFMAISEGKVVGFSAHSVYRKSYFGPLATDSEFRGKGIGDSLLWASLDSMNQQGTSVAEINWISEESLPFYVKTCGAKISGTFITLEKVLKV